MATLRYVFVDVFTDTPLQGNQLAVFTDARDVDAEVMQRLALEIGFSETVFVLPPEVGGHARMRIFTPLAELPFAGHPTLGTAFVLGAPTQLGLIRLETGRGIVPVELERDQSGKIVFGWMEQPVPTVDDVIDTTQLFRALGIESSGLPVEQYDNGVVHLFLALPSEDAVAALRPDMGALTAFGPIGATASPGSARTGRPGCSLLPMGLEKTLRPALPPDLSPVISRVTAVLSGARRSRSSKVSRSAGLPSSSPERMAVAA